MGNNKKKANLYNQAINIISKSPEDNSAKRRTAELHEKGGNLLSAAQIYEEIHDYEKASKLYEQLGNYAKAADCYSSYPNADISNLASGS